MVQRNQSENKLRCIYIWWSSGARFLSELCSVSIKYQRHCTGCIAPQIKVAVCEAWNTRNKHLLKNDHTTYKLHIKSLIISRALISRSSSGFRKKRIMQMYHDFVLAMNNVQQKKKSMSSFKLLWCNSTFLIYRNIWTNSEWEYAVFVPLISQLTRFLTALQTIFENTESFRELLACIFLQYWDCTTLQTQSRTWRSENMEDLKCLNKKHS